MQPWSGCHARQPSRTCVFDRFPSDWSRPRGLSAWHATESNTRAPRRQTTFAPVRRPDFCGAIKSAAVTPMARVAQPQPHQITSELRLDVIGKRGTAMPDLSIVHVLNLARLHVMLCDQLGTGEDFVERGG